MKIGLRASLVTAIVLSLLIISMIPEVALGGEKKTWEARDVWYGITFNKLEVPDADGHLLYLLDAKGISFVKNFGAVAGVLRGTMDFEKGAGPTVGYNYYRFPDGSTITTKYDCQQRGAGVGITGGAGGEGKWTFVKGTGKFDGISGGGTLQYWVVAPGQWYSDTNGEYTLP